MYRIIKTYVHIPLYNGSIMRKTILIVDSNDETRTYLKQLITSRNFIALEATDGEAALEIIERTPPDLIILDFLLSNMTGEAVCAKIKADNPNIIIIVLSAKAESVDIVRGLQIGADDYVTKPFDPEELMARIDTRLRATIQQERLVMQPELTKVIFRETPLLLGFRLIGNVILLLMSYFLTALLLSFLSPYFNLTLLPPTYVGLFLIMLIFTIVISIFVVLKWQSEYTILTPSGIMQYSGILQKKEQRYACSFVEAVKLEQSLFGSIFNFGTLSLYDPEIKEDIYLENITDPKKSIDLIKKILSRNDKPPMPFVVSET